MATGIGTLTELRLEADGLSGRISIPPGLRPAPGQYLMASSPDYAEPLPTIIYPTGISSTEVCAASPLPVTWTAGMRLALRGPLGSGFHLPPTARRIALASLEGPPSRLLPLAEQALLRHAAVAIYAHAIPRGLAEEVEVLPLDLLPEAPTWADYLAIEVNLHHLSGLRTWLGLNPFQHPACQTEILVITAMPCSGMGECGVCAVATRAGWALACSDGPVFDFNQLDLSLK